MASFINRNGRIRAQVWIKPLRQRTKTFGDMESAKAWAERAETEMRELRANGGSLPPAEPPRRAAPRRRDDVHALPRIPATRAFCGVYFLFDRDECVYVGQSLHVHARVAQHVKEEIKLFDTYAWRPCTAGDLLAWEQYYSKLLNPRLNIACRPVFAETIAILRASDELPKGTPKSLGDNRDLPESILSIMGATEK